MSAARKDEHHTRAVGIIAFPKDRPIGPTEPRVAIFIPLPGIFPVEIGSGLKAVGIDEKIPLAIDRPLTGNSDIFRIAGKKDAGTRSRAHTVESKVLLPEI